MINLPIILNLNNEATLISYFSFSPHGEYVLFLPLSWSSSEIEFYTKYAVPALPGSQFSVPKSCLTLFFPMDCIMPGFLDFRHLPAFAQIHVH